MSHVGIAATPKAPPAPPKNPAAVLEQGIGAVMATINKPADLFNEGFARFTAGLSNALPSFPAATMGSLAVGYPHAHPPQAPFPMPVIGSVVAGCCVSVLINGLPAARAGDIGLNPTCLGLPVPGFEIFTGSSKVFIGGARAARMLDLTMHCWPPAKPFRPGPKLGKVISGVNKVMTAMPFVGMGAQAVGVVADGIDAATAEDPAVAEAHALAAGMGAAQLAMDAAAMVLGNLIGKVACVGPPLGAIVLGAPNVLIGGFPVPSGMALAQRKLAAAELPPRRRGQNDENHQGNKDCG